MQRGISRRTLLRVAAYGGASFTTTRLNAEKKEGHAVYPVAIPIYQAQFVADRAGFFKEAGLECRLTQGGSGVKTREIIASGQADIGIGDVTHPMQLSNHGRNGRVLMPADTKSNAVVFTIRKDLYGQGITTLEALANWKRPDGRK